MQLLFLLRTVAKQPFHQGCVLGSQWDRLLSEELREPPVFPSVVQAVSNNYENFSSWFFLHTAVQCRSELHTDFLFSQNKTPTWFSVSAVVVWLKNTCLNKDDLYSANIFERITKSGALSHSERREFWWQFVAAFEKSSTCWRNTCVLHDNENQTQGKSVRFGLDPSGIVESFCLFL